MKLTIRGSRTNDLVTILQRSGLETVLFADAMQAARETPEEGILLVLSEQYPEVPFHIDEQFLGILKSKRLKTYLEFAAAELVPSKTAVWERSVVDTDLFPGLKRGDILDQHGCIYLHMTSPDTLVWLGRVAGYETACFGIPEERSSLLYRLTDQILVCTTKLSGFVGQRISPCDKIYHLFEGILSYLAGESVFLKRTPVPVKLNGDTDAPDCFRRSIRWFTRHIISATGQKVSASEGYGSYIEYDGHQRRNPWIRGDCTAEVALALAVDWKLRNNSRSRDLCQKMLDYLWNSNDFVVREDVPVRGMVNWSSDSRVYYGDDNARVLMSTFKAMELLGCWDWIKPAENCLYANARATGEQGFRKSRIEYPGEPGAFNGTILAPHYQCYLWAAFLAGSYLFQDPGLREKAQKGIDRMMEGFDHEWTWTNGMTQEYAKMLLPLSWASRYWEKNREYLDKILGALEENMHSSGAVLEKLGAWERGRYPQLKKNEEYGRNEAPIIQNNGDPLADLLYTVGFAFLGLHEARRISSRACAMFYSMKDFLCKIQVRSRTHAYLDGAWLRSFDVRRWEYHGSSSDIGWGAWCAESGWNNAWTAAVLGLDLLGESVFPAEMNPPEEIGNRYDT